VTDASGTVLFRNYLSRQRILDRWQSGLVTSILQQVMVRGTGTAAALGRPAAGKTGTTSNYSDAWFCGYTPDLATSVWVGYPSSQRPLFVRGMYVAGGTFPAQIWQRFMSSALAGIPAHAFPAFTLPPVRKAIVCARTGDLATRWCPERLRAYYFNGEAPTTYCSFHQPKPVSMPDLVGMPFDKAQAALRRLSLGWHLNPTPGRAADQGRVVGQTPTAGETILQGTQVTLDIGSGPLLGVPDLVGLYREAAEQLCTTSGFAVAVQFDGAAGEAPGVVQSQSPEAGSKSQGTITIVIAGKDGDVQTPDVVGLTSAEATASLNAGGLGVSVTGTTGGLTVVQQSPAPGTSVRVGSMVTVTLQ